MAHLYHPLNNPSAMEYNLDNVVENLNPNDPKDIDTINKIVKNVEKRSNYVMDNLPKIEIKYPDKKYSYRYLDYLKRLSNNQGAIPKLKIGNNQYHELTADLVPEVKEVFKEIARDKAVDLVLKRTKLPEDVFPIIKQYEGRGEIFNPSNKDDTQTGLTSMKMRKVWRDEKKDHLLNIRNPDVPTFYDKTDTRDELRRKRRRR